MRKFIILIFLGLLSMISYSLNFSVSPTKFDIDMKQKKTYELEIVNNTGNILRITSFFEKKEGYKSLAENIIVFPKKISIKPGGKKDIRFTIRDLEKLEAGSYKNLFVIREIEPRNNNIEIVDNKDQIFNINIITEVALHINGVKK
ncbi:MULTISPECIES: hypothetical protein [Fusobacterium]|jgi:P pilus assembly chaperone PapD|uniref:Pili assembly chaperone N-terminal domain-containing protein n=1 Tax=Fusobacterium hominis TaxID=2764326 RepID=A0A7G9GWT1_9FUSO|nr:MULTISPECIES: hypothetical protein [Fusobacterium]QNM15263.1 hypothetical protein H9Q81_00010 [Fusobacterium hominis]